ncbi:MAG TPA: SigB/SigF/SigG family RNA polymerase sigma factor [Actinomycetes bacterium]|nr:SigB/SigF/SigG family RNA polymerase sigma factor [Actinomycetes bacterium]
MPDTRSADQREEVRELLTSLASPDTPEIERAVIRDRLVLLQMPLVHHLAGRFRDRGEPIEDLVQVATIGLINSVDRFEMDRGVEFSTFATPTILGEIKRHFRDRGWAIRVPRRLQEMRQSLSQATEALTHELGRAPSVAEIAERLGLGAEDVLEGMESAQAYSTVPLDPLVELGDDTMGLAARLGSMDPEMGLVEDRAVLAPILAELPDRERAILRYRFVDGLTQTEIAERIGISQMHVSRTLTRTLAQLRRRLVAVS